MSRPASRADDCTSGRGTGSAGDEEARANMIEDLRELEQTPLDQHADAVRREVREHLLRALRVREPWAVGWAVQFRLTHWHAAGWGCTPACAARAGGAEGTAGPARKHVSLVHYAQPSRAARRRGRLDYSIKRRLAKMAR